MKNSSEWAGEGKNLWNRNWMPRFASGHECVKKSVLVVTPVKTGVQDLCKYPISLDTGFHRSDEKYHATSGIAA
ncbi:MAG: hypothetical protein C0392_09040 [Syntrophus sp. (in: bacteria)]|nr:hypothetical protein [Syntrophus sp. (in: bacteria)]